MKNSHATVSSRNEYKRIAYYIIPVIVLIVLSFNNFLLFHTLIELFSIIVGYIIFVIALYSYKRSQNNFLILLGIAYGFIGGLDLIHTLSYKGMGIFVNGGADLPTKLWIIARYLESISITVSLWIIGSNNRKYNIKKVFYLFFVIFTALLLSLYFDIFPS